MSYERYAKRRIRSIEREIADLESEIERLRTQLERTPYTKSGYARRQRIQRKIANRESKIIALNRQKIAYEKSIADPFDDESDSHE